MSNNFIVKILLIILLIFLFFEMGFADIVSTKLIPAGSLLKDIFLKKKLTSERKFSLNNFYSDNADIELIVSNYMDKLTDREKVAQLVVITIGENGESFEDAKKIANELKVGGFIFLKNSYYNVKRYISELNELYKKMDFVKPIFSIDGEPSLLHSRLEGIKSLPTAASLVSEEECINVSIKISDILNTLGIQYNFAPVCDYSNNTEVIGSRSFGGDANHIIDFCKIFIDEMQRKNIVATAKHFPGHGTIKGDTHGRLLFIHGTPPELKIFQTLIDYGVISIMVGHIAVEDDGEYDTQGRPSTLSRRMITDILKKKMGFKGLVVTDAMTMNAVSGFKNPDLQALEAGCDIILIPRNEKNFINTVTDLIQKNRKLRIQVMESVRKILKLKVCLGIIQKN